MVGIGGGSVDGASGKDELSFHIVVVLHRLGRAWKPLISAAIPLIFSKSVLDGVLLKNLVLIKGKSYFGVIAKMVSEWVEMVYGQCKFMNVFLHYKWFL